MKKLFIGILAVALVVGMSLGVMAEDPDIGESIADIDQDGGSNLAEITQNQDEEEWITFDAWITQDGPDNTANIDQSIAIDGKTEEAVRSLVEAGIYQEGEGNLADVDQVDHEVWVTQIGDWNDADIDTAQDGMANVYQEGNNNLVEAAQSGSGYKDISMALDVKQENTFSSSVKINQSDYGNATVRQYDQEGSSVNISNVPVSPSEVNVEVYQGLSEPGEGNVANVSASGEWDFEDNPSGDEQNVLITQDGDWNTADINQESIGVDFDATVAQDGSNNEAIINQ